MINKQNGNFNEFFTTLSSSDQNEKENLARQMMKKLNDEDNKKLADIIKDKNKIQEIINSDAAKELIEKLNKRRNG